MHKPVKYAEKVLTLAARGAWAVFDRVNRIKPNPSFTPNWSEKPLLKSWEKTKPPLGWPRSTDSLCPKCVPEIRQQIVDGDRKSTRLNSSHQIISYAVFCLKKKTPPHLPLRATRH